MFKKFLSLFKLENKIIQGVQLSLAETNTASQKEIKRLETEVENTKRMIDSINSKLHSRLTRIENLFEAEIKAKETARDELVRAKRLGK